MKKFLAILALVSSVSAFAAKEKISIHYSGFEGWGRTYYACDYVEHQTESFLKLFGATQIDVRCTGGIQPYGSAWPVSLTATFETPTLVGNEVETVEKVDGDSRSPACGLNTTIVKKLLPLFPNVKVLKKNAGCGFSTSNYSYTFSILK